MALDQTRRGAGLLLLAIVGLGAALRGWCFIGWGLGDDPYYASIAVFLGRGHFDLAFGSNYRLGLHLPNALALRALGASDFAFVLFPLLCSLATIPVTYLLGRRLAGVRAGLIGSALVAVSPFDAAYAGSMTIDVITSFLSALALLLVLLSENAPPRRAALQLMLAALMMFQAYFIKIPALLFVAVLAAYTAGERRLWRRHAIFYVALAALLLTSLLIDRLLSGSAFGYLLSERRTAPRFLPSIGLGRYLGFYLREMFLAPFHGTRPFGFTFYAVAAALAYAAVRRLPGRRLLVLWAMGLFLLLELLPNRLGLPYEPLPRFTRYLDALVVPGLLLVAIALDDLMRRHARIGALVLLGLIGSSLLEARRTAAMLQDGFADARVASRLVLALPPGDVYSDNGLLDRLDFDRVYSGPFGLRRMQEAIEKRRSSELLAGLGPGYVVTGGSRAAGLWQGAVFELGALRPPPEWRLLHSVEGEPRPWRREPLRIFAIER